MKFAIVKGRGATVETIERYLPSNYEVVGPLSGAEGVVIKGEDSAGWTMDDYVIPRLLSGLYSCEELVAREGERIVDTLDRFGV